MWWERPSTRVERLQRIPACLREDASMSLIEISRRTKIPTSTVFDAMQVLQGRFWFTAVYPDQKAVKVRRDVLASPVLPHRKLCKVIV